MMILPAIFLIAYIYVMFITFCQAVHVMLNEGRHVSKVDEEGQVKVLEK